MNFTKDRIPASVHSPPRGRLLVSYLANNRAFRGIGVARASALWKQFGEELYDVLEKGDARRLSPILGDMVASELVIAWAEKLEENKVIKWLARFNFNIRLAYKIIKIWGTEAIQKLSENPYRMLAFAPWTIVDRTALSLGITHEDDRRLVAAVEWACYVRLDDKHTLTPYKMLIFEIRRLLRCGAELAARAVNLATVEYAIIESPGGLQPLGPAIMERYIADRLRSLMAGEAKGQGNLFRVELSSDDLDTIISDFEKDQRINFTIEQQEAVKGAFTNPLFILTGGAGVGKTTTLKAIHEVSERLKKRIVQIALSGRAARQLRETTGRPAMTIAAFLNGRRSGKVSNIDDSTLIIVDEASMLDLPLTYQILRAINPRCNLLLVGDPYQLPPIGFGLVFHLLARPNDVPRVELKHVHRQATSTGIPEVVNRIRSGYVPDLPPFSGKRTGVSFINTNPVNILDTIIDVVSELGGINEVQILAATKRGPSGINEINSTFHQILSTGKPHTSERGFAVGDPVIYLVNDYSKDLTNGSLGRVIALHDGNNIAVDFGHRQEPMDRPLAERLALAYGITVHKSQGSQFQRVILPVVRSRILDRTLIYTAITRAVQQAILIGDYATLRNSVSSQPHAHVRQTGFASALTLRQIGLD